MDPCALYNSDSAVFQLSSLRWIHNGWDHSASALNPTMKQSRPEAGNSGYLPFEAAFA
ncbi:MAG: hypothetical protein AB8A32_09930 [Prochlorococcus sp.]